VEILSYARSLSWLRLPGRNGGAGALGIVLTLTSCLAAQSPEQPPDEYQLKAAFLYNFAKFVQWPSDASRNSSEPIVICVLGPDPFGRSLDDTVAGQAIEGRSFTIRRISNVKEAAGCYVLFFSTVQSSRSPPILTDLKTPGVLTIGDTDACGVDGVVITFKLEAGKVRFAINMEAAERQKLRISSRLLNLAYLVRPKRK